jgi:hypothetical protein
MTATTTTKLARAADLSTFPLEFLDQSGVGAGPFNQVNAFCDINGNLITPNAPYVFTPKAPGQHNVVITSSTALTIPSGAIFAWVQVSGGTAKYTTDGVTTPTTSVGMTLLQNSPPMLLSGATVLANFRIISSIGTLDVEYGS